MIITSTSDSGCPGRIALNKAMEEKSSRIKALAIFGIDAPCPACQMLMAAFPDWQQIRILSLDSAGAITRESTLEALVSKLKFVTL